jgi:Lon protease-like protein
MSEQRIAIFPLAQVVLFPRVQTPLLLFEPRYQQMAEHVLAGDRTLGMVTVPPEYADDMRGDPPVYPVGCAGRITRSQRQPDGRFHILLEGIHRFRIARELKQPEDQLYRVAEVIRLEEAYDSAEAPRVGKLRARLIEQVRSLVDRSRAGRGIEISPASFEGLDDLAFVNSLCNALAFDTEEKQGLLELDPIPGRFERLEALLSFRLAEISSPSGPAPGIIH